MSNLQAEEYKGFEEIKRTKENGTEYWSARELSTVLEYKQWRNFAKIIDRAKLACQNSGRMIDDDFAEVSKIVEAGATPEKSIKQVEKEQLKKLKDKKTKLMLDE